jgi:hypothetical protein
VVAANPSFGADSGYRVTIPVSPGPHTVCIDMIYGPGRWNRLRCFEVNMP